MRQRSSHCPLTHPEGRTTTVPIHSGKTIGVGLLSKILRDTEISKEDLRTLLDE
ncbi:MAG: type II toxin-antitoxin system HicA family toxin [Fimbriimonadales bacterium]